MKENSKKKIVVSVMPSGLAMITMEHDEIKNAQNMNASSEEICKMAKACLDAIATEILPQTEDAVVEFCNIHNAKLMHTLADYPEPTDDD